MILASRIVYMKLQDLITKVKERDLGKDELEQYRDDLSGLFAQMQFEMAELEKKEAIFMDGIEENESVAQRKIFWKATDFGQRLIELKRYCLATKEKLNSLKSRLYSIY